eukprot:scaffold3369_cov128-Chaetoceros_neogracile.AAC.1
MLIAYCFSNSLQAVTSDATVVAHGDSFFPFGMEWSGVLFLVCCAAFQLAMIKDNVGSDETVRVLKRERVVLGYLANKSFTLRSAPDAVFASTLLPLLLPIP